MSSLINQSIISVSDLDEHIDQCDSFEDEIDYNISGFVPLSNNSMTFITCDSGDYEILKMIVTKKTKITILMDEMFNTNAEYSYKFKICNSENGFNVKQIMECIFNFMVETIKECDRYDYDLVGFFFHKDDLKIEPQIACSSNRSLDNNENKSNCLDLSSTNSDNINKTQNIVNMNGDPFMVHEHPETIQKLIDQKILKNDVTIVSKPNNINKIV
jgi:hypothetical protein